MGNNLDKEKKYVSPTFFMRNPYMKFQNISMHKKATNGEKLQRAITPTFHLIGWKFNQVISSSVPVSIPIIKALA